MPEADVFQAPQGKTFHAEPLLQAITEAFASNGVLANGDAQVTADGSTAMGIDVAAASTGIQYAGTTYTPSASSFTLSDGPTTTTSGQDDRRVDLAYFDPSGPTYATAEGTADPNPVPPSVPSGSLMLAVILIPHEATDLAGENILNWRSRPAVSSPVGTSDISDDAVTSAKIATGAVGSDEIADTSIATADIADAAITAAKIGTGEVTTTELADGTIATADIASGAVTSTEISDGTIASADIGSGAVTTSEISDGTIADVDIDSTTTIARGKLDDERITTGAVTANTTTSGEEVVFVDTSGGAVTITLASADVADGNFVTIIDVGGASSSNNVTVDTESSETIDGASSDTISTDYGAAVYASDGTNWFSAGGGGGGGSTTDTRTDVADDGSSVQTDTTTINVQAGLSASSDGSGGANVNYEHAEVFEGRESGTVSDTNQGVLIIDHLADTEAVEVYKAALVNADGSAVATGVDLKLVTMDNAGAFTAQATLITGDGSTVFDDETGSPLGSYTNSSGGGQTIAVLVDNASGGSVDIMASVEGVTGV